MTHRDWKLLKLQYALKRESKPLKERLEKLRRLRRNKPMLEEERWKIDYEIQGLQLQLEQLAGKYHHLATAAFWDSPAGVWGGVVGTDGADAS